MLDYVDNYRVEAELKTGELINSGDISECIRVSLIPTIRLPQHDFIGLKFKSRFMRRFKKVKLGQENIGKLSWKHDSNIVESTENMEQVLKSGDMIRVVKLTNPYPWSVVSKVEDNIIYLSKSWQEEKGRDAVWLTTKFVPPGPSETYHCITCDGFRLWIKSSTGTVLATPETYELYI